VKEATSLSEATQRERTSGFKNEFIGKTTTTKQRVNNHKSNVNSGNSSAHLFTGNGEKQHGQGTVVVSGGGCWVRLHGDDEVRFGSGLNFRR
jgi:hypothetical protein